MPRISGLVLTLCRRRVLTPSHLLGKRSMSSFESWRGSHLNPEVFGAWRRPSQLDRAWAAGFYAGRKQQSLP